jgi:hypothetical protein
MAVAALVAVVAAGVGLLLPGAELSSEAMQGVRIGGVVLAGVGVAALVWHWRRSSGSANVGVMAVALGVAAVVMGVVALLALPYSDVDIDVDEDKYANEPDIGGRTPEIDPGSLPSPPSGGSVDLPSGASIEDPMYTVGINPSTGEPSPLAVDPSTGLAAAIDPETGELTPMQLDLGGSSSGSSSGDGFGPADANGLGLPIGIDASTGQAGVIGVTDPETGELGVIYEMDADEIEAFESDGAIHVVDDLGDIVPLDAEELAELEGEGDIGSIDFGGLDFEDFAMEEPPEGWGTGGGSLGEAFEDIDLSNIEWGDLDLGSGSSDSRGSDDRSESASPESDSDDNQDQEEDDDDDEGFFDGLGDLFSTQVLVAALLIAVLVAALIYWRRMLGRSDDDADPEEPEPEAPVTAGDAEAGLAASLDEAQDSGDPRQRIMAAYMRLLEALAAAGAPRQLQEAPHEHLGRVLDPLGVRTGPVHDLAELFVLARFSDQPVTEEHRASAVSALESALADLRARTPVLATPVGAGAAPG